MAGLIPITPTSVSVTGTSATISGNGTVTFTGATALTLNGVFTSTYSMYQMVLVGSIASGTSQYLGFQMTSAGTPDTGSVYDIQSYSVAATSPGGGRSTGQTLGAIGQLDSSIESNTIAYFWTPAQADGTTAFHQTGIGGSSGRQLHRTNTVGTATAYDGIYLFPQSSDMTGTVIVYGFEE